MKRLGGIPASKGIAIGRVLLYGGDELPEIKRKHLPDDEAGSEVKRFHTALERSREELRLLLDSNEKNTAQYSVFSTHLMMLEDPDFIEQVTDRIANNHENAEWAVWRAGRNFADMIGISPDPLIRERAADINDVCKRVLFRLLSITKNTLAELNENIILAARDLLPSEVLAMNKDHVLGIVMETGSGTSHTAIVSRAFNIPAVLGLASGFSEIHSGDTLIIDGGEGSVYINPGADTMAKYLKTQSKILQTREDEKKIKDQPALTIDGHRVLLNANIGSPEEAEKALEYGAGGIGLFRSEFLFIGSGSASGSAPGSAPSEDAQYEAYSRVLKTMGKLPVTVRTADLGADKISADSRRIKEENPLLGLRGIRLSLSHPDFFLTQLRALLRASVFGNLKILFPMISSAGELDDALKLFEKAKQECSEKKQKFAADIETGIMIETPASAVCSEDLAERAAFFSIGTNDLVQYTLAADRENANVSKLADPCHPAVLRLIKKSIDTAHSKGIKFSMCGEMAGDPLYTPLLLGLGLDEFSMTASSIPGIKKVILKSKLKDCQALAEKILTISSSEKIHSILGEKAL